MALESINPATGQVLRRFEALGEPAIRAKIGLAAEAFQAYRAVPFEHRALCLRKLAALLEGEIEELAGTITAEMGKPIGQARAEVTDCAGVCRYYAEHAPRMLAPEAIGTGEIATGASASYVRWDPMGVVLAVMPWSFPLWAVFRYLAPALMGGNVGLLKHASNVPQCALAIESLVRRAGFPPATFQTLLIEARQVETVLGDERVAAVTVTGGEAAGRAIAAQAGWLIKKSLLALGGSDAFVVMGSADLDAAIDAGVRSRCANSGQTSTAAKRFLVADEVYDDFERRFVTAMDRVIVGDPMQAETGVGPLATAGRLEELQAQVASAVRAGARVLTGGARVGSVGNFFQPTILAGVGRNSAVYRQEVFGPVAMLFRVGGLSEAIRMANETPFGLAASAWTRDPAEQGRLVAELECGAVFLNALPTSDPRLPSGGVKRSGYGRELSAAGVREFMNAKTVVVGSPIPRRTAHGGRKLTIDPIR